MKISKLSTQVSFIIIVIGIFACQPPKQVKKPDDLIPQEQLVAILTEIEIMDAAIKIEIVPDSVGKSGYKKWLQVLLDNYKTDTTALHSSLTYYSHYPDKMSNIYEKVADRIEKKGDAFYKDHILEIADTLAKGKP